MSSWRRRPGPPFRGRSATSELRAPPKPRDARLLKYARRNRRLGVLALGLALTSGCVTTPQPVAFVGNGVGPDTADGLYRVQATRVAAAFLKPGADFAAYESVTIAPVTVSYMTSDRAAGRKRRRGNEVLADNAMARFKRIFQQSFERELGKSQYRVVADPGPGVLSVSGHIVDLFVDAPPFRGGETDYILDAGEMTLILNVQDSETGAPLARIADRRGLVPAGTRLTNLYRSNPVNNWGGVREVFSEWARVLRDGLDELRELPPVPLPDSTADP